MTRLLAKITSEFQGVWQACQLPCQTYDYYLIFLLITLQSIPYRLQKTASKVINEMIGQDVTEEHSKGQPYLLIVRRF